MDEMKNTLSTIVNKAKEKEVIQATESWSKWKRGSYIFDCLTNIFIVSTMVILGLNNVIPEYYSWFSYASIISHAMSTTFKGLSIWCSKKFHEQSSIVNSIIDSVGTGRMPMISILPTEQQSNNNNGEEKI